MRLIILICIFIFFSSANAFALPVIPENLQIGISFKIYNPELFNQVVHHKKLNSPAHEMIHFQNSEWKTDVTYSEVPGKTDAVDLEIGFICREGKLENASVALDLNISNWSSENYVLVPAALYDGNRYPYRRIRYSPKLMDPRDIGPDKGIIISDVPKLNYTDGPSFVQLRSGAMSTPSVCFHDSAAQKGFIMLTHQGTKWGDNGISITENKNRDEAVIAVTAPVVRELYKYRIADSRYPSDDVPAMFEAGDTVKLKVRLYYFDATKRQDLFNKFAEVRKDLSGQIKHNNVLPLSEAFRIQEKKFNRDNWVEEHGYYSVGMRETYTQDWAIGWTGGMISTYPLLFAGNEKTRENVIRNFDWLFPDGISPSGFFWDSGEKGTIWYGGDQRKFHTKDWHLIRRSADAVYYIIKQFYLMRQMNIPVKESWSKGTQTVCDAMVKLWDTYGQMGQFVNSQTGKIEVGGSTSAAIAPAALLLAADFHKNENYKQIAIEIAEYMYRNYITKGITCGGPGDALQNPDSESAYAMLESFMTLYEHTGDSIWLKRAKEMAHQFATWVMTYNYHFPAQSLFGKLNMQTAGTVWANTQNKHSAPGICTHSGVALLRLYRASGDERYLQLLQQITKTIPQYLSHPLRPIPGMKEGWMSERINTTDWLEGIGEIMYGSTWSETALMLTTIEIPGLYVVPEKNVCVAFDNIVAKVLKSNKKDITIKVSNPTSTVADFTLLVENVTELKKTLAINYLYGAKKIKLLPGEEKVLTFKRYGD